MHFDKEDNGLVGILRATHADADCVKEFGHGVGHVIDFCGAKSHARGVEDTVAVVILNSPVLYNTALLEMGVDEE